MEALHVDQLRREELVARVHGGFVEQLVLLKLWSLWGLSAGIQPSSATGTPARGHCHSLARLEVSKFLSVGIRPCLNVITMPRMCQPAVEKLVWQHERGWPVHPLASLMPQAQWQ